MLQIDETQGSLEEQLREAFLTGLDFEPGSTDTVTLFVQDQPAGPWVLYEPGVSVSPAVALPLLVALWSEGKNIKVEFVVHLGGDNWDDMP